MTREEHISNLKTIGCDGWTVTTDAYKSLQFAIKTLEQKPILDKIRAEIEQLPTKTRINWDGCCPDLDYPEIEYVDVSKKYLLSIIDKYKSESEDNNETD